MRSVLVRSVLVFVALVSMAVVLVVTQQDVLDFIEPPPPEEFCFQVTATEVHEYTLTYLSYYGDKRSMGRNGQNIKPGDRVDIFCTRSGGCGVCADFPLDYVAYKAGTKRQLF